MDRLISLQAAIDAVKELCEHYTPTKSVKHPHMDFVIEELLNLPSAQPEVQSDGTLHITADTDISQIRRVLVSQEGTQYGNLYYADAEPQWIPCSETEDLPEHEVLCCDKYGEELIGWLSCEDDQWLCESDGEMMYDPIAWREKPEPWREEE